LHFHSLNYLFRLLFFKDLFDLVFKSSELLVHSVDCVVVKDARDDFGRLCLSGAYGGSDNFAIVFGREGYGATRTPGTRGTSDSVKIDLVGLWSFEVYYAIDVFDIKTTGSKISCEQVVDGAITEGFDGFDTLGWLAH